LFSLIFLQFFVTLLLLLAKSLKKNKRLIFIPTIANFKNFKIHLMVTFNITK
jgi:hypothetical protein